MIIRPNSDPRGASRGLPLRGAAKALGGAVVRRARGLLPRSARYAMDGLVASVLGRGSLMRHNHLTAALRRRRRTPQGLFVGWILHHDHTGGATRVHGLLPHAFLQGLGVNSVILRQPRRRRSGLSFTEDDVERLVQAGLDVVVFQGVTGEGAIAVARALRAAGTRTVYTAGDFLGPDIAAEVDWVVCASEELLAVAGSRRDHASVIESPIDAPPGLVKDHAAAARDDRIRVVWVGYPENLPTLAPVREALADPRLARYELVTISRGPGVTHQWHPRRVFGHLLASDIAVLPVADSEWYRVKPNTRMTMLKALGIPMVASPIDSYTRTLTHGHGCYFARTPAEWVAALLALGDPARRREVGLAERDRILATYGLPAIGKKWLALFHALAPARVSA